MADIAAELRRKKEAWFAQRAAAQERESVENELSSSSSGYADRPEAKAREARSFDDPSPAMEAMSISNSEVIDRITERLTSRLKEELRSEVRKEELEASRKKVKEASKMEGYLASELEQTTCPICYEVMQPPDHTPVLLFPCGHTFCNTCLEGHIKANHRKTCPYCRHKIESQATNVILMQLIDGFTEKKKEAAKEAERATKFLTREGAAVVVKKTEAEERDEKAERERAKLMEELDGCSDEDREQLEAYVREWRMLNVRYKIYENEVEDCDKEMAALKSRKEASAHVRQHLSGDMEDAKRRLEMVQQEIELINAQLEQQRDKDRQVDLELAEKAQRRELVTSTRNNLSIERDKIRLMVAHFAPKQVDIDKVLDC